MTDATPRPRLAVLNRETFTGARDSSTPCLLNHAVHQFTQSGRASILLALEVLGVGPGDSVMMPSYHCPTMIAPVIEVGAKVVFYPITGTGFPDIARLDALAPKGLRAILAAHYFGLPHDMEPIRRWCDERGVALIEDCAHALFGMAGSRAVGAWGDLSIASLTKFLPVSEGGSLLLNRPGERPPPLSAPGLRAQLKAAYDIVHTATNHGRLGLLRPLTGGVAAIQRMHKGKAVQAAKSADVSLAGAEESVDLGKPHQALTGASRWMSEHVPRARIVERRRANYAFFAAALADRPRMRALRPSLPAQCAPYVFPLWVEEPDPGYLALRRARYPVSRWDWLWPEADQIAGDQGPLWSRHILQLACHQDLREDELHWMVETLGEVYG